MKEKPSFFRKRTTSLPSTPKELEHYKKMDDFAQFSYVEPSSSLSSISSLSFKELEDPTFVPEEELPIVKSWWKCCF